MGRTPTIAELTVQPRTVEDLAREFFGGDVPTSRGATGSSETEHIAAQADTASERFNPAPGFPEFLEKVASTLEDVVDQLQGLPKTASITGDPKLELSGLQRPESDPVMATIHDLVNRVMGPKDGAA